MKHGTALCQAATGGLDGFPYRDWDHDAAKLDRFDGHVKIIKHLLGLPGIDPNAADDYGFTPIYNAASSGPPVLVRALLDGAQGRIDPDRKSDHDNTPLSVAAAQNNYEALEVLLAAPGTDPTALDMDGDTPLMCAAINAAKECLGLLLAHPVARQTVNTPNKLGFTPLAVLCYSGRI
ncbi:ankyrin repeat-containing domain protein, partial [Kalaharituber pfeilii]